MDQATFLLRGGGLPDLSEMPWQLVVVLACFLSGVYAYVLGTTGLAQRDGTPWKHNFRPASARTRAWLRLHAGVFGLGPWAVVAWLRGTSGTDWVFVALGGAAVISLALIVVQAQRATTKAIFAPSEKTEDGKGVKRIAVAAAILAVAGAAAAAGAALFGPDLAGASSISSVVEREERTGTVLQAQQAGEIPPAATVPGQWQPAAGEAIRMPANASRLTVALGWDDAGPLIPPDIDVQANVEGAWVTVDRFRSAYDNEQKPWGGSEVRFVVRPQGGTMPGAYHLDVQAIAHEVRDCTIRAEAGAAPQRECGPWQSPYEPGEW